ncbi:hypothetical protein D3C76_1094490 [compost metagenome]
MKFFIACTSFSVILLDKETLNIGVYSIGLPKNPKVRELLTICGSLHSDCESMVDLPVDMLSSIIEDTINNIELRDECIKDRLKKEGITIPSDYDEQNVNIFFKHLIRDGKLSVANFHSNKHLVDPSMQESLPLKIRAVVDKYKDVIESSAADEYLDEFIYSVKKYKKGVITGSLKWFGILGNELEVITKAEV